MPCIFSSVSLNFETEPSSVRICTVELELGLHLTVKRAYASQLCASNWEMEFCFILDWYTRNTSSVSSHIFKTGLLFHLEASTFPQF